MTRWSDVAAALSARPPNTRALVVLKAAAEHPRDGGLTETIDLPVGQLASFRLALATGGVMFVREYPSLYEARIARFVLHPEGEDSDADLSPTEAGVALGALAGLLIGKSFGAICVGALVGAAFANARVKSDSAPSTATSLSSGGTSVVSPNNTHRREKS